MSLARSILIGSILFCFPLASHAAVVINEVAWMGTLVGPNEEWIELYNDGSSEISLDGWVLTDNAALEIPLLGTIGRGDYAVLERTDDDTVSGTAFLIYTGALSNDGRTLTLRRADASIEDQVAGGEGWSNIGGDNTTKDTAQRTSAGWITAVPTPGNQNATVGSPEPEENTDETEESNTNTTTTASNTNTRTSGSGTSRVEPVKKETVLALSLRAPKIAYVNQRISLEAIPSGIGETLMRSLTYVWNFGDTYAATGTKVTHTFRYPGEYVMVVEGAFATQRARVRQSITVLPVTFELSRTKLGDIQIHNTAKYEIDLSGFTLRGEKELVLPENTIILPQSTLTINRSRLETGVYTMVALYDGRREVVATLLPSSTQEMSHLGGVVIPQKVFVATTDTPIVEHVSFVSSEAQSEDVSSSSIVTAELLIPIGNSQSASVVSAQPRSVSEKLPYLGLIGIIMLGLIIPYWRRREVD